MSLCREDDFSLKAVLLSLKPEWWTKMLSGEKTLEIRKTAPMAFLRQVRVLNQPFTVYVYISGTGHVMGKFTCLGWLNTSNMRAISKESCVPAPALHEYAGQKGEVVAWRVRDPAEFSPIPLEAFGVKRAPMSWQYIEVE